VFERYVAIGDSSTEGLQDLDDHGELRGWSFRLADRIARDQGRLLYANLAVRGATTRQIARDQLARAVAMKPDLATVFSGTNDVLRKRFEVREFLEDVRLIQRALRAEGATVLTFTLPDLTPLLPLARRLAPRIRAMNDAVRAACAETGTRLLDFAELPLATDPRLWNEDRIHANPAGHERIAAALAEALDLPGTDGRWREPLPAVGPPGLAVAAWREVRWSARHLLPWTLAAAFGAAGRRSFPGRRPTLEPFAPVPARPA
jgi:lysophospholipase L1-like esterase